MLPQTFLFATALLLITCLNKTDNKTSVTHKASSIVTTEDKKESAETKRIGDFANRLKNYAVNNGYNQSLCYLVDMKKESGENRFYIYDLKNSRIIHRGLVTHGSCGNSFFSKENMVIRLDATAVHWGNIE